MYSFALIGCSRVRHERSFIAITSTVIKMIENRSATNETDLIYLQVSQLKDPPVLKELVEQVSLGDRKTVKIYSMAICEGEGMEYLSIFFHDTLECSAARNNVLQH